MGSIDGLYLSTNGTRVLRSTIFTIYVLEFLNLQNLPKMLKYRVLFEYFSSTTWHVHVSSNVKLPCPQASVRTCTGRKFIFGKCQASAASHHILKRLHFLSPSPCFCNMHIMQMHPKLKVSSTIGLKKPKPTPFMQHFYENIEDFADEVVTTHEDPQAGDSKLEVKVSENQEPLNKVAVKYRWRGKCRLCGDAAGGMFVTDSLGTSSNFTKCFTHAPKRKEYFLANFLWLKPSLGVKNMIKTIPPRPK